MSRKRIALIHPRLVKRGGLETRLLNYTQWFCNQGCEVSIYCYKRDESIELPPNATIHQFNLSWIPKLYRHRYFTHLIRKENVQEKHDLTLSLGRTGHQDAALGPGNHIGYLRAFGRPASSLSDLEQISMDRMAYESSEYILAASQFMADEIVEFFNVDPTKVHVLNPPFNPSRFQSVRNVSKTEARRNLGLNEDRKLLALVSTGHKVKGGPFLLDLMKTMTDVTLAVAGSPFKDASPNVVYLGFLEDPSLLYRAADATVLPSVYEAFGQVVIESLHCGTPVLVSENVGAKEVIPAESGKILPVMDNDSWRMAIEMLAEKPERTEPLIDITDLSLDSHMTKMCTLVGLQL